MEHSIENKVAKSGLITLDLMDYKPEGRCAEYDLANDLWQGLALKERDFRDKLSSTTWGDYAGKHVAIHCSADAIVPTWAYMLVASYLSPLAASIFHGTTDELESKLWLDAISSIDYSQFIDRRVIVKGCSEIELSMGVYMLLQNRLQAVAKSVMFGEPCSTVPIFKKRPA